MYLPISIIAAVLCTQLSVDGFGNSRVSGISGRNQPRTRHTRISQGKVPRSTATELSAGSILPTVYSAIAVASVIAFHEAGTLQSQKLITVIRR